MTATLRYDRRTVLFHWLTAGLIALMWSLAQIIDLFSRDIRVLPRSLHIAAGIVLLVVVISRLIWRNTSGTRLPSADQGLFDLAARAAHWGLYALVLAALGAGMVLEAARGDNIFWLGRLPGFAGGDRALIHDLEEYHGLAVNLLLILAGLHGAAAMVHRYLWKDTVLQRMTIG
jgi:cytochrome b561